MTIQQRAAGPPPPRAPTVLVSGPVIGLIYAVMTVIVVAPILLTRVPALCDYLNHLARMRILLDGGHTAALRRFYTVQWRPIPYLGVDTVFALFGRGLNIYDAGRAYLALCVLAPPVSAAILHYAIHRRLSLVPVAGFLFSYNFLLAWGFINYLPGLCLAVIAFAGWLATRDWPRWPRAALFALPATGLYLFHVMAFVAYGLAVAGFEIALTVRAGWRPWRGVLAQWSAAALQAAPAVALALAFRPDPPVGPAPTAYLLSGKLTAILSPVLFQGGATDVWLFGWVVVVLAGGLLTGRLRLAPVIWGPFLAVLAVAVVMPSTLQGIFGMDYRLPLMLVLLVIAAAAAVERAEPIFGALILAGFVALTAARSVEVAGSLHRLDGRIARVRAVLAALPRGQRLLVAESPPPPVALLTTRRATQHVGLLAVIDRDAFAPNLFTAFMTVRPTPAMLWSSTPAGPLLRLVDLRDGLGRRDGPAGPPGDGFGGRVYWLGWERKFDYLLYEHFDDRSVLPPGPLRLVTASPEADLYRIVPPAR